MTRLLFVDDHPLYRSGVQLTLARALPDLQVELAGSADEALAVLEADANFDLCLTDFRLPGRDGLGLLGEVGRLWPAVAGGLLCADPTPDLVRRARAQGCVACLSKDRDMAALVQGLSELFEGRMVFDGDTAPPASITERRRHLLQLASNGLSNKAIARELGCSVSTVKEHWTAIFDRLSVANRAEAVSRAHQLRLI